MEMSDYKASGYTRLVRRRAFTKWANIHLDERFLAISDLIDLADCFVTIQLLEIITKRNLSIKYHGQQPIRIKRIDGWKNIALFLKNEDFPSDLSDEDLESLSRGSVDALLTFVWLLIELFLINPCKKAMLGKTQSSARKFLLSWLKQKLPYRSINNFDDDWKDGTAICELVNSLQPGAIPEKSFSNKDNGEGNAKLGIQVAHEKFGIPQIISPFDIASAHIDELSILTYLALFCKYETLTKDDGNNNKQRLSTLRDEENMVPCKAYGSGLKSGELGKIAEFIIELNGAKASDITIAIECKPTTGGYNEKPELSVKAVGKATYAVKYLPTKQGEYIISVLHCGAHLLRSPFHLAVTGHSKVNGTTPDVNTSNILKKSVENILDIKETLQETPLPTYKSMKESKILAEGNSELNQGNDKKQEQSGILVSQIRDIPLGIPMNSAEGPGLVAGEVGRVGKFTVITDNSTKGPLSVCISCPAVSIPVPYVKSEKKKTYTEHRVLYIPTEPGTYEIFINWGEKPIRGSPFKVFINDVHKDDVSLSSAANAQDDLGGKGKIRVYYAATSTRSKVQSDKELLEIFLTEKGIPSRPDFDSWIPLDVGMTKAQREKVFQKVGHRYTPVLFVDARCIGTYEDIVMMDREGLFDSCLDY